LSALSGIAGVILLGLSFATAVGPPPDATYAELVKFGGQHKAAILWGAWLQAVAPVLIVLFAFALVRVAGAGQRLAGWMTFFGASVLMTVSLIEITFYIAALFPDPAVMPLVGIKLIYAVQHLYFMIAAPALFLPLGVVLIRSRVLPPVFGYLAVALGAIFAVLGITFQQTLILPNAVTGFAGIQALWWVAAAVALMVRGGRLALADNV
jgi:hypothetical protein